MFPLKHDGAQSVPTSQMHLAILLSTSLSHLPMNKAPRLAALISADPDKVLGRKTWVLLDSSGVTS